MVLDGQSTIFMHGKARTLYVSIPSKMAQDSAFTLKNGDKVTIQYDPIEKVVIIKKQRTTPNQKSSEKE